MSIAKHMRPDNLHASAHIHYPAMLAELKRDGGSGKHHMDEESDEWPTARQQQVRDEIMDRVWAQVPVDSSNVTVGTAPPNFFDALFGTDPRVELAKIGVRG